MKKLIAATCAMACVALSPIAYAETGNQGPGVTESEVKIGQTMP
jgi:branched-chain amino acid transport system substrate-binding protein